jgi:hypothetical protein
MKRKTLSRILSLLLVLSFALSASALALHVGAADANEKTVAFNNPAIPADTNETVDLTQFGVEFSASSVSSASKITWSSSEISVSNGKVTPTKKGVYSLTATDASASKTVYLVVKAPTESEYVLFEDDFSTAAGNLKVSGGSSSTFCRPVPPEVGTASVFHFHTRRIGEAEHDDHLVTVVKFTAVFSL